MKPSLIHTVTTTTNSLDPRMMLFLTLTTCCRYIFPGLALGAALGQTGVVTNAMINRAAEALVELINEDDLARRATFPENVDIREIACHLAAKVFEQAVEEKLVVSREGGEDSQGKIDCSFLDFQQSYVGGTAARGVTRTEEIHLLQDVVPRLQASGLPSSWQGGIKRPGIDSREYS